MPETARIVSHIRLRFTSYAGLAFAVSKSEWVRGGVRLGPGRGRLAVVVIVSQFIVVMQDVLYAGYVRRVQEYAAAAVSVEVQLDGR